MKNSKKLVNLISLVVLVATNILSPLSYVTAEDDLDIGDTASYGAEQDSGGESYDDSDESIDDDSEMAADSQLDGQDDEGDIDNSSDTDVTAPLESGSQEGDAGEDSQLESQNDEDIQNSDETVISNDSDESTDDDGETEGDSSAEASEGQTGEISEGQDDTENDGERPEGQEGNTEITAIDELKELIENEESYIQIIESEEIYGTGEYEGVKVEVYAQTGAFALGTILNIIPITGDDEMSDIQDVLEQQKNVEKSQKVIAFDITFLDPETEKELQPLMTGAVQVTFNYEENDELVAAEENEEQEVKVYHLNDKDEEGEKIESITGTIVEDVEVNEEASEEENVMVVEAESFSVYTIVVQVRDEQVISFQYGMISISNPSNPSQIITIMDRNLGATTNDITDKNSYGYHYQWGNNYGFDSSKDSSEISTSSTQVNVSSLSEYSGSTFIIGNSSWMTSNKNLWGVGGQGPCPEGWHVPTNDERSNLYTYYNNTYINSGTNDFLTYFKLPLAGYRSYSSASVYYKDSYGYFWSSSVNWSSSIYNAYFSNSSIRVSTHSNAYGNSVRCFKNSPIDDSNLHKITIDYKGGKGSVAFISVEHGSKAQIPSTPTRRNSNFLGWYLSGTDTEFNFTGTNITEDISIYAKWSCKDGFIQNEEGDSCFSAVPYNFDANGGFFGGDESNTVQVLQYLCNELDCHTDINLQNPDRVSDDISQQSGWMFAGWYMKSGINDDWGEEFNPKTATANTVYAKWLPFNDLQIKDGENILFTIMDRNLGATESFNQDFENPNVGSYGFYYQWGNNYGFSSNPDSVIKMTQNFTDASEYGPGNYYSSNVFRKISGSWDSSNNRNLWGGSGDDKLVRGDGSDDNRQGPCPEGYHVPSALERELAYNTRSNLSTRSQNLDYIAKNFGYDFMLPFAGGRSYNDASISDQGSSVAYWSSSPRDNSDYASHYMVFGNTTNPFVNSMDRTRGFPIRCFKNEIEAKKLIFMTEMGEKISEYSFYWREPFPYEYRPENPTRVGYEFVGWYESGSNEEYDFNQERTKSLTLYEKWINTEGINEAEIAKLATGAKVNSIIKTLAAGTAVPTSASDEGIKGIKRSETLPENIEKKIISSPESETPIFARYDESDQMIKYYTKAKKVEMNEDSSSFYGNLKGLTNIKIDEFDTKNVKNMSYFFGGCSGLTGIDFSGFDTTNVVDMSSMFSYCTGLTYLDLSSFDTSNVMDMSSMFYNCTNLTGLVLDGWDLSQSTNGSSIIAGMFSSTNSLKKLSLKGWKLPETFTSAMGNRTSSLYTTSLEEMDVTDWDLSQTTDIQGLFAGSNVRRIVGLETWNTSNITNMNQMFYYCQNLTSFDVSHFETNNVTNMGEMFRDCDSITGLDLSSFDTRNVKNMYYMFGSCDNLTGLILDGWDLSQSTNGSSIISSMFYSSSKLEKISAKRWKIPVTFTNAMGCSTSSLCANLDELDVTDWDLSLTTDISSLFYSFKGKKIKGLETRETSNITNMSSMFSSCINLTGLVLDGWDLSQSTNGSSIIGGMFGGASNLQKVSARGWKLPTTFIAGMGGSVSSLSTPTLQELDVTDWDLSQTTNINGLFGDCKARQIIGLETRDTIGITDMGGMFYGTYNLTGLDLSNFDTTNVTNMSQMFQGANKLKTIYVGGSFRTSNVTSSSNMFYNTTGIMGGNGTKFNSSYTTGSYAHIDAEGNPGYFTDPSHFAIRFKNLSGDEIATQWISTGGMAQALTGRYNNYEYYTQSGNIYKPFSLDTPLYAYTEIYASGQYVYEYNIIYNLNGEGTITGQKTTYTAEDTFTLVEPTRTGYKFIGWTGSNGDIPQTGVVIPVGTTGNLSYYANWTCAEGYMKVDGYCVQQFTVTFDANRGTIVDSQTIGSGQKIVQPTTKFPGYTFGGWFIDDETFQHPFDFTGTAITGDITLYAKWTYNLPFDDLNLYFIKSDGTTGHYTIMDRNMGATEVYNGKWDNQNANSYGYRYKWGNNQGFLISDSTVPSDGSVGNWIEGEQGPCPVGYHIPDSNERESMESNWESSKNDADLSNNLGKQLASDWLLPPAGYKRTADLGSYGYYWSSSPMSDVFAYYLYFGSSNIYPKDYHNRSNGLSIRCTKASPNSLSFTLHANGGSRAVIAFTGIVGSGKFTALGIPTRGSDEFDGWYDAIRGGNKLGVGSGVVSDIYARWLCDSGYIDLGDGNGCVKSEATLLPGKEFNAIIKTLANNGTSVVYTGGDEKIEKIIKSDNPFENGEIVSVEGSIPVYVKYDSGIIYYYSEADKIYLNEDSSYMFYNLKELTTIDINGFDSSNTVNMSAIFSSCFKLTWLTLENFDTSNVTDMSSMFNGDWRLQSINLSGLNTSKVTNMSWMFNYLINLESLDVSSFDTSQVTNMEGMFYGCKSLNTLDVSNFVTSGVTNMNYMFYQCENLLDLDVSNFNTSNVTSMNHMFAFSNNLRSLNTDGRDLRNLNEANYIFYMTKDPAILTISCSGWKIPNNFSFFGGGGGALNSALEIDVTNWDLSETTILDSVFKNAGKLKSIIGLDTWDTSNITSMHEMFYGCYSLTGLVLDGWDLSNLTGDSLGIGALFLSASNLKKLSIKGRKIPSTFTNAIGCRTSNLCASLDELDVSNWDLSKTENINGLFGNLSVKKIIGLNTWDTSNITSMQGVFQITQYIEELDLSSWNTSNVTDMNSMFQNNTQLKTIYVGENFSTESVTTDGYVFQETSSLVGGNGRSYSSNGNQSKQFAKIDNEYQTGYFTDPSHFAIRFKNLSGDEIATQWISTGGTATGLSKSHATFTYYVSGDKTSDEYDFNTKLYAYSEVYADMECDSGYTELDGECVQQFIVTFNATANGGTATTGSVVVTSGSELILSDYEATPDDNTYTFIGWSELLSSTGVLQSNPIITGNKELYAVFSKTLSAIFNPNGSQLNGGNNPIPGTCDIYNSEISCTVEAPTIIPSSNTPIEIGFNTGVNSTTNHANYNTGTKLLTLDDSISGEMWYAITKSDDITLNITYGTGVGVADISKDEDSCIISGTYNGVPQATGCTVIAPDITLKTGYGTGIWTNMVNPLIVTNSGGVITITSNNSSFIANATPNPNTPYTVHYYLENVYNGNYTLDSTEDKHGTTDAEVSINELKKGITGAHFEKAAIVVNPQGPEYGATDEVDSITIDGNGNTEVYLFYKRNVHTVSATAGEGVGSVTGTGEYKYGQTVTLIPQDINPCYTANVITFTMPDNDVQRILIGTIKTFTVTLQKDEHIATVLGANTYDCGVEVTITATPSTRYEFNAWMSGNSYISIQSSYTFTLTGNVVYKATSKAMSGTKFTVKHWIKDVNANTYTKYSEEQKSGETDSVITLANHVISVPCGRYVNGSENGGVDGVGTPVTTTTISANEDTVINLFYDRNTYVVTTSVDTGIQSVNISAPYQDNKYECGAEVTVTATSKTGYHFTTYSSEDVDSSASNPYIFTMPDKAVSIQAQSNANTYTVNFNANGGRGTMSSQIFTYNVVQKLSDNLFTRTGYIFTGWSSDSGAIVPTYTNKQLVSNLATTGSITLYAVWTTKGTSTKYTVRHIKQGLNTPTDDVVETKELYAETNSQQTPAVNIYTGFNSPSTGILTVTSNGDASIDYVYTRKDITLTLNNDNGTQNTIITGKYEANVQKPTINPSKSGYTFTGWAPLIPDTFPATNETYVAQYTLDTYTITYHMNSGTNHADNPTSYTYLSGAITLKSPTREGYVFNGWTGTDINGMSKNVIIPTNSEGNREYTAIWGEDKNNNGNNHSGGGSGGGGGGSSGGGKKMPTVDTHGSGENLVSSGSKVEELTIENDKIGDKSHNSADGQKKSDITYEGKTEMEQAYNFSYKNGITTVNSFEKAKIYGNLTRIQMAKMLSYFAINVLGEKPNTLKVGKFNDVSDRINAQYNNAVVLSYQLGIMGINMKNNNFRPNDEVTRAEFATALSRMLYHTKDGKGSVKYYEPHIAKLYKEGIITNTNPKLKEKRGYIMLMLLRSTK